MRVRPADAERRNRRPPRAAARSPRHRLVQQGQRRRIPLDVRAGRGGVQRARQLLVTQRQHQLDQPGHARGRLGVPDVGLHRAQPQGPFRAAAAAVRGEQRLRLDGIAQFGPGAVRLDRVHVGGGEARVGQGRPDDPLLGVPAGRRQPVRGAVGVDGAAPDHRQHSVPLATGLAQRLQEHHARALGHAHAVGTGTEGLAAAVRGQHPLPAHLGERPDRREHRRPAGQRHRALPAAQRLHRQVHRGQRRGTGGVHAHRGSLQAEGVGDAAGQHAQHGAGEQVPADAVRGVPEEPAVLGGVAADEHAGTGAAQGVRIDTGPFRALPGQLQQQPLLRIHREGLTRRDPEEARVKTGHVVQEAALAHVRGVGPVRGGVEVVVEVPVAVPGHR